MAAVREIAAKAGVSPAAVSRVLNIDRSFSVSDETRKRILAAADELQYRPARPGRGMTKVVMLILHSESEELEDPYYLNVRLHIRRAAEASFLNRAPELPPEIPETGDGRRPGIWTALLTVSGAGFLCLGGAALTGRRKRPKR